MSEKTSRTKLEQEILTSAKKIRFNPDSGCFDEEAQQKFGEAWHTLVQYYNREDHNDTDISVEIVHSYLDSINHFFGIWQDQEASETCRERAVEALQELEAQLNYIMEAVERRIYPNGRE